MRPSHPFCRLWPSPLSAVPWLSQPCWRVTGPSPQHRGVSKFLRTCALGSHGPTSAEVESHAPPRQAALPTLRSGPGRTRHRPGMWLSEQLAFPTQRWDSQGCLAPNSFCASLSQAGGLMPVVLPTWMECTTHRGRTQISSTVLSGTTGRARATHSRPRPWWSVQQISKLWHTPEGQCLALFPETCSQSTKRLRTVSASALDELPALGAEGAVSSQCKPREAYPLNPHHSVNRRTTPDKPQPGVVTRQKAFGEINLSSRTRLTIYRLCCHNQECYARVDQ